MSECLPIKNGVLNEDKPHHLLGCSLPQEGMYYRNYPWIYSMDTSNPIVHAIKNIKYGDTGLWSKESQKLFTLINTPLAEISNELVKGNIKKFRTFWNE